VRTIGERLRREQKIIRAEIVAPRSGHALESRSTLCRLLLISCSGSHDFAQLLDGEGIAVAAMYDPDTVHTGSGSRAAG
jgi:hypothetical protein